MLRFFSCVLLALAVVVGAAQAATICGILDGPGCVPTVCSVFDPRPCLADEDFPFGDNLRLTIDSQSAADAIKPDRDLNTLRDLFSTLRACWLPPAQSEAFEGMQMSILISFKRSGEIIAPPRLTYALPGASAQVRNTYRNAIAQSLAACAPLRFTKEFAGAIAGHPIMIRYVDNRELAKQR